MHCQIGHAPTGSLKVRGRDFHFLEGNCRHEYFPHSNGKQWNTERQTRQTQGAASHNRARTAHPAPARPADAGTAQRQAELFYLQKQIQAQTPMVIVLDDGEQIEGVIEWYDRNALKMRGRTRTLVYKNSIKYMYKVDDNG